MEMWRTVPVNLDMTESDIDPLHETIDRIREAATNVGCNHHRRSHKPSGGDAPVGVRIDTGTLITSGFTTAPALVRVGVHGESSAL